jgi:hypothetical protein
MRVALAVALALALSAGMGIMCHYESKHFIPPGIANFTQWEQLSHELQDHLLFPNVCSRVLLLLLLHSAHVYLCLPMLHVTKILYGFWLGLLCGWTLCCCFELSLFRVYLYCVGTHEHEMIAEYVRALRASGQLFRSNVLIAMSSFPLAIHAAMVQGGGVTVEEFMSAHALVTAVMTFKNVACGVVLASLPSPHMLLFLGGVFTVSTCLPTAATVYVTSHGLLELLRSYSQAASGQCTETPCASDEQEDLCALCAGDVCSNA